MKNYICLFILISFVSGPAIGDDTKPKSEKPMTAKDLFAKSSPAVVRIITFDGNGKEKSFGSGVFVSSEGLVVTNYHVVEGGKTFKIILSNNATFDVSKVIAADPKTDLALLDTKGAGVPFLRLTNRKPAVGDKAYAVGNPRGLKNTLSEGIISGTRKWNDIDTYQTTASISPGSSGGPLLSDTGQIVGITTFIITKSQNLNFAISYSHVDKLIKSPEKFSVSVSKPRISAPIKHYNSLKDIFAEVPKDIFPKKGASWTYFQNKLLVKWFKENFGRKRVSTFQTLSTSARFRYAGIGGGGQTYVAFTLYDEFKDLDGKYGKYHTTDGLAWVPKTFSNSKLLKLKKRERIFLKGTIHVIRPKMVGQGFDIEVILGDCDILTSKPTRQPKPKLKPRSRPKPKPKKRSKEEQADSKLRLARTYLKSGFKSKARKILLVIIKDFPNTKAAQAAKIELGGIGN